MNLIGYCRVSTQEQADHGVSIDDQNRRLHAYTASRGDRIVEVYVDRGVSGSVPWRERELREAYRAAVDFRGSQAGSVGLVAVSLDRLSRSIRDTLDLFDTAQKNAVDVLTIKESMDTSSPTGRFTLSILAAMNQFTRESIAEKTRDALEHLRKTGKRCGMIPYGMQQTSRGAPLSDNHAEQCVLHNLAGFLEDGGPGYGARLALKDLKGIYPVNPRTGRPWTLGTVANLVIRVRKEKSTK